MHGTTLSGSRLAARHPHPRAGRRYIALALVTLALVAGCGDGGDQGPEAQAARGTPVVGTSAPAPVLAINLQPASAYQIILHLPDTTGTPLILPAGEWLLVRPSATGALQQSPSLIRVDTEQAVDPDQVTAPAPTNTGNAAAFTTLAEFVLLNHLHVLSTKALLTEDVMQPLTAITSARFSADDYKEMRESTKALLNQKKKTLAAVDSLARGHPTGSPAARAWANTKKVMTAYFATLDAAQKEVGRSSPKQDAAFTRVKAWVAAGTQLYPSAQKEAAVARFPNATRLLVVARSLAGARQSALPPAAPDGELQALGPAAGPNLFADPVPFDIKVNDWAYNKDGASLLDGLFTTGELEPKDPQDLFVQIKKKLGKDGCVRSLLLMAHGSPGRVVGQVQLATVDDFIARLAPLVCPGTVADRGLKINACNVAAGPKGAEFVARLANGLNIPVTAYTGSVFAGTGSGLGKVTVRPGDTLTGTSPVSCSRWPEEVKPLPPEQTTPTPTVAATRTTTAVATTPVRTTATTTTVRPTATATARATSTPPASATATSGAGGCPIVNRAAIEREVQAIITGLPFYGDSEPGKKQTPITDPLRVGYNTQNNVSGVVEVGLEGQGIGINWLITPRSRCRTTAEAKMQFEAKRDPCGTKNVLPGPLGDNSCVGSSAIGGCNDCNFSGDPYLGGGQSLAMTVCADISVSATISIYAPQPHGPRNKPEVISAVRAAGEKWALEVGKQLVAAVDRGCGRTGR
ncbi:MAG: DUF4347 domain-containing protein [Chloroflexi bacterium]|nr:DUF4347 domain-containing protein [Chloroflexota bacterium]